MGWDPAVWNGLPEEHRQSVLAQMAGAQPAAVPPL